MHPVEGPIVANLAQRLWLLKRHDEGTNGHHDACTYAGAFTLLDQSGVRVVFVRLSRLENAEEDCLDRGHLRPGVARGARSFHSLDAALACADQTKNAWLARGWTEIATDPRDR